MPPPHRCLSDISGKVDLAYIGGRQSGSEQILLFRTMVAYIYAFTNYLASQCAPSAVSAFATANGDTYLGISNCGTLDGTHN